MFCHVLTGVLVYTVLICKDSQAGQLNAILGNPGWERITHVNAKCRLAFNRNGLFTEEDLFVSGSNLSIPNEHTEHYMVTHLVACVYVNAMVKFMNLLRDILVEYSRARRSDTNHAAYKKRKSSNEAVQGEEEKEEDNPVDKSLEKKSKNSKDRPKTNDHFKVSWAIFNFALLQLTSNSPMFGRMYSAIRYLVDTIPSGEYTLHMLKEGVLPCLESFKEVSNNLSILFGTGYTLRIDSEYNSRMSSFPRKLSLFLTGQYKTTMESFLEKYCTVTETSVIPSGSEQTSLNGKDKPSTTDVAYQLGEEIQKLVDEVCENCYSHLGFVYNSDEGTTSLASQSIP